MRRRTLLWLGGLAAILAVALGGSLAAAAATGDWLRGSGNPAAALSESPGDTATGLANLQAQEPSSQGWLGAAVGAAGGRVVVVQVVPDSPAATAGLQRSDIVLKVNGADVHTVKDVRDQLLGKAPGDSVTLTVLSGTTTKDITVTLAQRPAPTFHGGPLLPELNGVPLKDVFSHFRGGSFQFTDASGKPVTLQVTAGTIASVSGNQVTVTPNGGGAPAVFTVSDKTVIVSGGHKVAVGELKVDDPVVVWSVGSDARAITSGRAKLPLPLALGDMRGRLGPRGPHRPPIGLMGLERAEGYERGESVR